MFEINYRRLPTCNPAWQGKSFLVVDDCYDIYSRDLYIRYINDNAVKCIASQDHDLSYLSDCPDVEYLLCDPESNHLDTLYSLRNLKGLTLFTDDNDFDFSKLTALSFLQTKYECRNKSWLDSGSVREMSLIDYETGTLRWLSDLRGKEQLSALEIYTSYGKFRSLNGLKELSALETLILNYCRQLTDIEEIAELESLKVLRFHDNPRAKDLPLNRLTSLEELYMIDFETQKSRTLDTLAFIGSMPRLHTFVSNYNVLDGDLSLLLGLKNADILRDRKHYNIKNEDLPHTKK